jgi:hypothetical protein
MTTEIKTIQELLNVIEEMTETYRQINKILAESSNKVAKTMTKIKELTNEQTT